MTQYQYPLRIRLCKKYIRAVMHASCTRRELINMKVEHVTIPLFEMCSLFPKTVD